MSPKERKVGRMAVSHNVPRFGEVAAKLAKNGYSPLPLYYGDKKPSPEHDWPHYRYSEADLKKYAQHGTGILCGKVVALDIDVMDEKLSAEIEALANRMFGAAPRRIGQPPKVLLLLRSSATFSKQSTASFRLPGDEPEVKPHKVEILAKGQQFVAYNEHPDTKKPYVWNGAGDPLTVKLADLREVTERGVLDFKNAVERLLIAAGGKPVGKLLAAEGDREHTPAEKQRAEDPKEFASALAAIPNDCDRQDWVMIAHAVKGALGDAGLEIFDKWSKKHPSYNARETVRVFRSAKPKSIGAGTIYYLANLNGWERPASESVQDFYAYMPDHSYICRATRELWPAVSVNSRVIMAKGKASVWLDLNRHVEQMTWAPGALEVVPDRVVSDGGWIDHPGYNCYNLYRPPTLKLGDAKKADRWLEHVRRVFPDDDAHLIKWLAHRVQRPGEKINHAIVLSGEQGIGKDTILEPVKYAIGPWNFAEITPHHLLGPFNGFVKSVILRVSEARDLGDVDRYGFYEHIKLYTAAPPDVLRCNEKHLREHAVMNVTGVVLTSNHKTDGIYLPADDRRHFVAWSQLCKDDFAADYWTSIYRWYFAEGSSHVAAYLASLDLSGFDPKAPPPKTDAFWEIVNANRSPEESEMADVLEKLKDPAAVTLKDLLHAAGGGDFGDWLRDRKNRRAIPHRLSPCGYSPVRNPMAKDGLWKIGSERQVVYAKKQLSESDRLAAATARSGVQDPETEIKA